MQSMFIMISDIKENITEIGDDIKLTMMCQFDIREKTYHVHEFSYVSFKNFNGFFTDH
jgi:hypothetical protein